MEEIWKPVVGFEGVYSISNRGRLKREKGKTSNGKNWPEKLIRGSLNKYGYVKYTLTWGGRPHYKVAHRLVCEAFHGPAPEGKNLVLHKDDNPQNNIPENLYWGDLSDNQKDILRNGNNYGRNKTHCINGHEYTEENTYRIPKTGSRACQTCRLRRTKLDNERKKRLRNGDS